jgi:hypothetical protein
MRLDDLIGFGRNVLIAKLVFCFLTARHFKIGAALGSFAIARASSARVRLKMVGDEGNLPEKDSQLVPYGTLYFFYKETNSNLSQKKARLRLSYVLLLIVCFLV